jgi:hypothetical protein
MRSVPGPHCEVQRTGSFGLFLGAKDYIDSGLAGDLCDEIGPATGKRAAPDLDALAERCHAGKPDGSSIRNQTSNMSFDVDSKST